MLASKAPAAAPRTALTAPALGRQQTLLPARPNPRRDAVVTRALDETNFVVSLLSSTVASTMVAGVTLLTAPDRDSEIERIQTVEGAVPLAAAVVADSVAHSIPGVNVLLSLLAEPVGATAGVAYMMSMLLSAKAIDPETLAPKGTVLSVETSSDNSAAVRKPFTQIVPTVLQVIDWKNEGSSGKGWDPKEGVPKLPINSVAIVLGVGCLILEAASHAPVFGLFMPRVLGVACWYALAGYALDKRA